MANIRIKDIQSDFVNSNPEDLLVIDKYFAVNSYQSRSIKIGNINDFIRNQTITQFPNIKSYVDSTITTRIKEYVRYTETAHFESGTTPPTSLAPAGQTTSGSFIVTIPQSVLNQGIFTMTVIQHGLIGTNNNALDYLISKKVYYIHRSSGVLSVSASPIHIVYNINKLNTSFTHDAPVKYTNNQVKISSSSSYRNNNPGGIKIRFQFSVIFSELPISLTGAILPGQ